MKTLMLLCSLATAISAAEMKGKVVGVKAGDALEILSGGKVFAVRIEGIDCPARDERFGKASRRFAAEHAFMADVTLEIVSAAGEKGFAGRVKLPDGRDLAALMIGSGMAWLEDAGNPGAVALARLEKEARDAALGLWAAPEDEADTDWRKEILARREVEGRGIAGLLTANDHR
jgi:endonuclease YncB( thermonuclease family)